MVAASCCSLAAVVDGPPWAIRIIVQSPLGAHWSYFFFSNDMLLCRVPNYFGLCSSLSLAHRCPPSGMLYLQRGLDTSELSKLCGFCSFKLLGFGGLVF